MDNMGNCCELVEDPLVSQAFCCRRTGELYGGPTVPTPSAFTAMPLDSVMAVDTSSVISRPTAAMSVARRLIKQTGPVGALVMDTWDQPNRICKKQQELARTFLPN